MEDAIAPDLAKATEGQTSGCWDGEFPQYIDHIVLGKRAAAMVVLGTFRQIVYTEGNDLKEKLSDHCPIAVDLMP